LPTHKSVEKRLKTAKKANLQNREIKSRLKTVVKKVETSPDEASLKEAVSTLDKAARRRVIHPNKASRIKSRLFKLAQKKETPPSQ
jgi:small subunit ribosomal protein S20